MQAFFEKLFSGFYRGHAGYIELRAWPSSGEKIPYRRFYPNIRSASQAVEALRASPEKLNIFFGVAPRSERGGTKESIRFVSCLWADLDGKRFASKADALKSLEGFSLSPSLVIDSGNGYHAYWLLAEPTSELEKVEAVNAGIAQVLGGDKTHDVSRILRVPGTCNWKDPSNAKPVRIIQSRSHRYTLADFEGYVIQVIKPNPLPSVCLEETKPVDWDELEEDLDERFIRLIRHGIAGDTEGEFGGDRSRLDMSVVCKLVDVGLSDAEIVGILTDPSLGISDKTLDKKGAARRAYLRTTLSKARRFVQQD
ncbi:MAG: hypothetical protein K2X01_11330 [Cyanobacteria bacterium]|nr:hypothetical protein [Cyanobacteriota bacterium]